MVFGLKNMEIRDPVSHDGVFECGPSVDLDSACELDQGVDHVRADETTTAGDGNLG